MTKKLIIVLILILWVRAILLKYAQDLGLFFDGEIHIGGAKFLLN